MGFKGVILFAFLLSFPFLSEKEGNLYAQESFGDFIIIGNDIGQNMLNKNTLIKIFKGQVSLWSNGNTLVLVLPSQKSIYSDKFSKLIFNASTTTMRKYWLSLVFQGRVSPPHFFDSAEEVISFVKKTRGAIALVPKEFSSNISKSFIISYK